MSSSSSNFLEMNSFPFKMNFINIINLFFIWRGQAKTSLFTLFLMFLEDD